MKKVLPVVFVLSFYPMACSAKPPVSKVITYDKVENIKPENDLVLSSDIEVHDSTRVSTMSENFFCENQTMNVELSQRFEERKRISVDLSVEKNGEKLSREELSKSTRNIQGYKFYDMTFSCFNGVYGVSVIGYKIGINGARPNTEVFNYHVDLETGEVLKAN